MRKIRAAVFAGVAALAAMRAAVAASHDSHVMKLDLPDGSVARIEYQGVVAPKVMIAPALDFVPVRWFDPFSAPPFTLFDRVAADMDRQTDRMMQQVRALHFHPNPDGKIDLAAFRAMPAGTVSYSFVSTGTGTGMCSRSVQVTLFGPVQQPKMVSSRSGDCHNPPAVSTTAGSAGQTSGVTLKTGRTRAVRDGMSLHTDSVPRERRQPPLLPFHSEAATSGLTPCTYHPAFLELCQAARHDRPDRYRGGVRQPDRWYSPSRAL